MAYPESARQQAGVPVAVSGFELPSELLSLAVPSERLTGSRLHVTSLYGAQRAMLVSLQQKY